MDRPLACTCMTIHHMIHQHSHASPVHRQLCANSSMRTTVRACTARQCETGAWPGPRLHGFRWAQLRPGPAGTGPPPRPCGTALGDKGAIRGRGIGIWPTGPHPRCHDRARASARHRCACRQPHTHMDAPPGLGCRPGRARAGYPAEAPSPANAHSTATAPQTAHAPAPTRSLGGARGAGHRKWPCVFNQLATLICSLLGLAGVKDKTFVN